MPEESGGLSEGTGKDEASFLLELEERRVP